MKNRKKRLNVLPHFALAITLACGTIATASFSVLAAGSSSSALCDAMANGGSCTMDMGNTSSLPTCCQSQTSESKASASKTAAGPSSQAASTAVCSMPGMAGDVSSATSSETASKDPCGIGVVDTLSIESGACGQSELQKIKGLAKHTATFEKKDESDNVLYSWSFKGTDITAPADVDMNVEISTEGALADTVVQIASGYGDTVKNAVYLHLAQSGVLPGKATLMVASNGQFSPKDTVNVYYYNADKNRVEPIALGVKPEGGYVSFTISHASDYFLTAQKLSIPFWTQIESWQVLLAAVVLGAAIGVLTPFLLFRKKARAARKQNT
ncbi:MAG: hypothetical protein ABF904_11570 [Ethanoligenens sp.]